MAARVLLQRRAAPLTAALLAGGIALRPSMAHAEAPNSLPQSKKKPIYDDDYVDISAIVAPPSTKSTTTTTTTAIPSIADDHNSAPAPPASESDSSSSSTTTLAPTSPPPASTSTSASASATEAIILPARSPTPTERLAAEIRKARLFLYRQACAGEDSVNAALGRAFALEQSFTSTVAGLAPPRTSGERLVPGLVYVLVATMAGSIVTRRSNVVFRAAGPAALGLGVAWAVIPVTMGNVAALAWEYEKRVPAVADAHTRTREGIEYGWHMAKVHTEVAGLMVQEKVTEAREAVEGWVRKGK